MTSSFFLLLSYVLESAFIPGSYSLSDDDDDMNANDDGVDDFIVDDDGAGYAGPIEKEMRFAKFEEKHKRKFYERSRHRG